MATDIAQYQDLTCVPGDGGYWRLTLMLNAPPHLMTQPQRHYSIGVNSSKLCSQDGLSETHYFWKGDRGPRNTFAIGPRGYLRQLGFLERQQALLFTPDKAMKVGFPWRRARKGEAQVCRVEDGREH